MPNLFFEWLFKEKVIISSIISMFMYLNVCWIVGNSFEELNGYGTLKPRNLISTILGGTPARTKMLPISNPHDFRQVSAIIDVDIVPETCRRVRLLKHGSDKPLGFYIRDGTSVKVTQNGRCLFDLFPQNASLYVKAISKIVEEIHGVFDSSEE